MHAKWVQDGVSGFVIFLIALPLSVGIALASGAPATAGILAAIVGGMLGAWVGGSALAINGPAAGLIVIVLGAILDLGGGDATLGFKRMLAATVVAGGLQIVMAVLRLGALGVGVPGSVIHGMLTGIGVIIMAKQFHIALGVVPESKEVLGLIAEIPKSVMELNPEVGFIAAVGLLILIGFKTFKGSWAKYVPAPLLVVISGIFLAKLFDFDHEHLVTSHSLTFHAGPKLLLNLPANLRSAIVFPDFSAIATFAFWRWTISLALVASIESLLSAAAIDRMDPLKRTTNLDRELMGKGICNLVLGCIGGLPIIAEMVRSSANVRSGATSRWANFMHGTYILAFLILFPAILHEIPLGALAAILITVGYALAHPTQFLHTAEIGKDHFAAYLTTLFVTLASDLLVGVTAGILVELAFNLGRGTSFGELFRLKVDEKRDAKRVTMSIRSPLVFTNFLSLKKRLEAAKEDQIVLDLSHSVLVDHTALDHLHRIQAESAAAGRAVVLAFHEEHKPVSKHPLAARRRRPGVGR